MCMLRPKETLANSSLDNEASCEVTGSKFSVISGVQDHEWSSSVSSAPGSSQSKFRYKKGNKMQPAESDLNLPPPRLGSRASDAFIRHQETLRRLDRLM
jgi:hypothetical protein